MANSTFTTKIEYAQILDLSEKLASHAAECLARRDVAADLQVASRLLGRLAVFQERIRDIVKNSDAYTVAAVDIRTALSALDRAED